MAWEDALSVTVLANVHAEKDGQVLTGREVHVWHLADGRATAYGGVLEPHDAFDALLA